MEKRRLLILLLLAHTVFALPPRAAFNLHLNKLYDGVCDKALQGVLVKMSYEYDFENNRGLAKLDGIAETPLAIDLHPLGVASRYVFMSDMSPKTVKVNGSSQVLYRVFFDMTKTGEKSAAIMFGKDGNCTLSTENYD